MKNNKPRHEPKARSAATSSIMVKITSGKQTDKTLAKSLGKVLEKRYKEYWANWDKALKAWLRSGDIDDMFSAGAKQP